MRCREFLNRYSDWRDGLILDSSQARKLARHIERCPSCARWDQAYRRGLAALQTLATPIEPSPGFAARLEARLGEGRHGFNPPLPPWASLAAALALLVGLVLLVADLAHDRTRTEVAVPVPAVPFPKPVANAGVPFVSFQDPRVGVVTAAPTLYGTGFVERPAVYATSFR